MVETNNKKKTWTTKDNVRSLETLGIV
jgi:hypothetical protein